MVNKDKNGGVLRESSNERNYPEDDGEGDDDDNDSNGEDVHDDIDDNADDKMLNMQGDVWLIS